MRQPALVRLIFRIDAVEDAKTKMLRGRNVAQQQQQQQQQHVTSNILPSKKDPASGNGNDGKKLASAASAAAGVQDTRRRRRRRTRRGPRRGGGTGLPVKALSQHIRLRWKLLSPWSRGVLAFLLLPLLAVHVSVGTIDLFFHRYFDSFDDKLAAGGRPSWSTITRSSNNNETRIGAGELPVSDDEFALSSARTARGSSSSWSESEQQGGFVVVINTYRRPAQLARAVRHYAGTCGRPAGVSHVFVVWCEEGADPPADPDSFFFPADREGGGMWQRHVRSPAFSSSSSSSRQQQKEQQREDQLGQQPTEDAASQRRRVAVRVIRSPNSLNGRFSAPIPALKELQQLTNSVFMVDDDVAVDCASLRQGFLAWMSNPRAMVGYYPRLASPSKSAAALIEHCWPIVFMKQQVNFVLTKACFLHQRYLELYSSDVYHPKEIKDYVDKYMNCEDVAMSLLVANYTRYRRGQGRDWSSSSRSDSPGKPPVIYVEGQVSDAGLLNGISTKGGFVESRSACLTDLSAIYERHGWGSPFFSTAGTELNNKNASTGGGGSPGSINYDNYNLRDVSWIQHMPGFWWQSRPSNPFEWFALLDFFK